MSQTDSKLKAITDELDALNEQQKERLLWWLSGATSVLKTEKSKG